MNELVGEVVILYVGNGEDFTELTTAFLEREYGRFRVEMATPVVEGPSRAGNSTFDCVMSDYNMSEHDGLDLLETLREGAPNPPFVLFTGEGSEGVASGTISTNVTDYLQGEQGTSQCAVLTNRIENVVERHRSRRALETNKQYLSLFIEQSPLSALGYDSSFQIVGLSKYGEGILGCTEEELRGHSWETIIAGDSCDDVDAVTDQLAVTGGDYRSIDESARKDDEHVRYERHNWIIVDDNGKIVDTISLFQDVTERVHRRNELGRANTLLSTLIRSLPVGVLAKNSDRTVLAISGRLLELFGISEPSTELIGADYRGLARKASELVASLEGFVEHVDELVVGTESVHNESVALIDSRMLNRNYEPTELPDGTGYLRVYRGTTEQCERE